MDIPGRGWLVWVTADQEARAHVCVCLIMLFLATYVLKTTLILNHDGTPRPVFTPSISPSLPSLYITLLSRAPP